MAEVRVDTLVQRLEHDEQVTLRTGTGATGWQTADTYKFKNNGRIKMLYIKDWRRRRSDRENAAENEGEPKP